ncbi:hypothetical protein BH09BAC5_BH09BAC5_27100 [soil metagenome]
MKKILTLIILLLTTNLFAQTWTAHNAGTTSVVISISFPSSDTGYIVTDAAEVRKTTDGASSWTTVATPIPEWNVYFLTGQKGFAYSDSIIYRTVNGGTSWTEVVHDHNIYFTSMVFADQNTGYATGLNYYTTLDSLRLYKTNNGGASWVIVNAVQIFVIETPLFFLSSTTGFWGNNNGINSTTDGGTTFANSWNDPNFTDSPTQIDFPNADTGFVIDPYALAIKTFDGGTTWSPINYPGTSGAQDLHFFTGRKGFVCGGSGPAGWVQQTSDAGASWTPVYTSAYNFYCMDFPNDSVGYVGGDNGTVLKFSGVVTGVSEIENQNSFTIYPNPAKESITINEVSIGSDIYLKNISGQIVRSEKATSANVKLNLKDITPGIYFGEITNGNNRNGKKLVVY